MHVGSYMASRRGGLYSVRRFSPPSILSHRPVNSTLLPLAVSCTALYLGLGLLPFTPTGVGWGEALGLLPGQLAADGSPFVPLLLALQLGYLWQGVAWPRAASRRAATATAVFLGLGLLAMVLLLGQIYFSPRLAAPGGLFAPVLGFAAGTILWWLLGPPLSGRLTVLPGALWPVLVIAALLSVLVPLDLGMPMSAPALSNDFSSFVSDIPRRFYLLIKSAILWVPLGFILTLAGRGELVPCWGVALPAALLLMGWPYLGAMPLREALELVFALPGLWLGAWLGERTRLIGKGTTPAAMLSAAAVDAGASSGRKSSALSAAPATGEEDYGNALRRKPDAAMAAHSADALPSKTKHAARRRARYTPLGIALGLGLLILALIGLFDFPRWQVFLTVALAIYAGILWYQPLAWLVVVPAALPLLDLAPWTGRFFFDEFDLLMLVTAGVLLSRGRPGRPPSMPRLVGPLVLLFLLSSLASILVGVFPLATLDANAFSSYWSPYNSLRVAKGVLWGGVVFLWLRQGSQVDRQVLARLLALGMGLGLLGIGVVGAWEHGLYVGFEGGHETYRIFSIFSSMHTGGGHIEAYLVAALPFLWLATPKFRYLALTGPVMALTAYVMLFTVARGGVLAMGVALAILLLASVRLALRARGQRYIAPMAILTVVGLVLAAGMGSGYLKKRFAETGRDWQTRVKHWSQAIEMMEGSSQSRLFGMGLGSFPRIYQERGPLEKQPASFGFAVEQGNTHFRLGSGATVYYAQRIPFLAGQNYRLEMDIRGRQGDAAIDTPVCEKQMLNSRQCEWFGFSVPGDGQWHRVSKAFSSSKVGAEDWIRRPPVELFLYNPGRGGIIDVDNLRLVDASGHDVLCNGDFSRGGDCWFFKTHSHLPWHIKNVWAHVLFEQGWVGLMLFTALTVLAIYRLIRAGWRGHRLAWAWLASLAGLLTVGMFDSLLDAPRIAMLLVALLLLGSGWRWSDRRPAGRSSCSEKTKPTGHQLDQGQHGPEDGDGLGQADDVQYADAGPPVEVRQP